MKIYCSGCQLYLGDIEKASLRKNISYLCNVCETKRYENASKKPSKQQPVNDLFGDIFGGKI